MHRGVPRFFIVRIFCFVLSVLGGGRVLIKWNDRTLEWFRSASEYTSFHRKLAELLLPYIEIDGTLCDLGCGIGLIDFALCEKVQSITCVDIDPEAVRLCTGESVRRGIKNIEPLLSDAKDLTGTWDTVISVFHGTTEALVDCYVRFARKKVVAVTHTEGVGNFGPREYKSPRCNTAITAAELLGERGVEHTLINAALEYGQPFRKIDDAREFVEAYSKNAPGEAIEDYLSENLVETNNPEYPLYLPNMKNFGIFVIDGTAV